MKIKIAVILSLVGLIVLPVLARELYLENMEEWAKKGPTIKVASDAYIQKMGGIISATASCTLPEMITLGYDIPNFGKQGEKIWQACFTEMDRGDVRATMWIHPDTLKVYFLHAPPSSFELPSAMTVEQIKEARKAEDIRGGLKDFRRGAPRMARAVYTRKTGGFSEHDRVGEARLVKLGFGIEGFAEAGETVWAVRITRVKPDGIPSLHAILWGNTIGREKFRFLCGPGDGEGSPSNMKFGFPVSLAAEGSISRVKAENKEVTREEKLRHIREIRKKKERIRKVAKRAYRGKINRDKSTMPRVYHQDLEMKTLESDIPDFGKRGDQVWKARVTDEGQLMATFWIHPDTLKVHDATSAEMTLILGIADNAYAEKMNGTASAMERVAHQDLEMTTLGYDIPGFGKRKERVVEVRVADQEQLRATMWVHPDTLKVYFVHAPPESIDLPSPMTLEQIKKARKAEKAREGLRGFRQAASGIARRAYTKKTGAFLEDERVGDPQLVELGLRVEGFAEAGETVCEVHITRMKPDGIPSLRAILWVNPKTKNVHFVCGGNKAEKTVEEVHS